MMSLAAGKPATQLIRLASRANQPLLLIGSHGVGKDAILADAAHSLGIDLLSRDLSLMEGPDLLGLPVRSSTDGRTRYAPPGFLPTAGRGLLAFTELNRAPRWVRAPCLTLLTDRTLGDYALPPGWLPVAAINPPAEDYEVDDLDPALRSRLSRLTPATNRHDHRGGGSGPVRRRGRSCRRH
jgi:MoxR-like ATPase